MLWKTVGAIASVAAILAAGNASAENQPHEKKATPANRSAATGPQGFGAIKIGMTREALEQLKEGDGVYLVAPLTAEASNEPLPPGASKFATRIMTPFDGGAIEATFTIVSDVVTGMSLKLSESAFEMAKSQIAAKYGRGKLADTRKAEDCLYRNGAHFKVKSGFVANFWRQSLSPTDQITTSAVEFLIDLCPSSLADDRTPPTIERYISVEKTHLDASTVKPKPNLF
ncbi:hypothetical protein C7401_13618 [Paraburkholderia unamae]|uniref:hypothetical protein n=1 Tax=Paraburkholderia unamae TaxID=219649 RepID=UPI000DC284B0|nr:hypothetical protein [Paraburkholderia unamae]RAR51658.1 hypothetical protein C7401_13618 [Paraburkholderia unamae]